MKRIFAMCGLLISSLTYGQGVKMSSFALAPSVDTGKMKFVVVFNSAGSYYNQQLGVGMFARYMGSIAFTGGYGIINSSGVVRLDSSVAYSAVLSTMAAGYGVNYTGRTYKADTGVLFPKYTSTLGAGYGLAFSGRTFRVDTGTLLGDYSATLAAGYGLTFQGRTYKADTGTTFSKFATTLAAGYGLNYSGRTLSFDTTKGSTIALLQKKIDSLNSVISGLATISTVNTISATTYTLTASDRGKVISCTNSSAVTITVPAGLGSNFYCTIQQVGTGLVTPTASGTTLNIAHGFTKSYGQNTMFSIMYTGTTNTYILQGDMQ